MNYHSLNEQRTRYNLIDPEIRKAGWNLADRTSVGFEIPVKGYDASPQSGINDFLRTVQTVFIQKRKLEEADLYEAPFSNFGANAVEKLFSEDEIKEVIELRKKLAT